MKKIKRIKKLRRIIATTLIASVMMSCFGTIHVSAAGNMAFSVGCDYGYKENGAKDIDTSPDALKACDYYAIAGYTSRYTCNPNLSKMRASYNGTKLMESDIVMLSGHANSGGMHFNSLRQGGTYDFWVTTGSDSSDICFQEFTMSKIKLLVLAGCKTALETDTNNIMIRAFIRGAQTVIGFKESIGVSSQHTWLNRFNNCIALGYTIQGALDYANSFTYADEKCKNYDILGDGSQILKRATKSSTAVAEMLSQDKTIKKVSNVAINTSDLNNKEIVKRVIKESYSNFFFDDFGIDVIMHNSNKATVTVVENIGGFKTQNAYVLFYENGRITDIYDRTVKEVVVSDVSTYATQSRSINKHAAFVEAAENISDEYTIIEQNGKAFFDVETGKKYYMVFTEIEDSEGAFAVYEYKYEL